MDPENGLPVRGETAKGIGRSSWARGQAWGIYGLLELPLYPDMCVLINSGLLRRISFQASSDLFSLLDLIFTRVTTKEPPTRPHKSRLWFLEMAACLQQGAA
jgi:hypothetical protein